MKKKLLAVPLIALGAVGAARAQDQAANSLASNANVAREFALTSAASTSAPSSSEESSAWLLASATPPAPSLAALSFRGAAAGPWSTIDLAAAPPLAPATPAWPPAPAPVPQRSYTYKERDYSFEFAMGFALVRFRSAVYYASAPGVNLEGAWWFKDWVALEGSLVAAYAPAVYRNEHIKYLGYGAGPKFSLMGRSRLEPWAHAIVGGAHILPQTAGSKNGLLVEAGAGIDYGLVPRVSARLELDYLSTHLFGQWQNSAQGILSLVVHF
jgi:hypothetical protein